MSGRGLVAKVRLKASGLLGRLLFVVATTSAGRRVRTALGLGVTLVIGDSHVRPLRLLLAQGLRRRQLVHIVSVSGATASGLPNPNSSTGALATFQAALARLDPGCRVIVGLGEVDAAFLCFLRAQHDGQPVRHHTEVAFARYVEFLETEVLPLGVSVSLIGVIAPTVEDYAAWAGLDGARREVRAGLDERLLESRFWNERSAQWCGAHEVRFVDVLEATVDARGVVRAEFLNPDASDHHVRPSRYVALVREQVLEPAGRAEAA